MPNLRDILAKETGEVTLEADFDRALLGQLVVGLRLTTGAPCTSHAELFAPWPGPEAGIRRWFQLANGVAVGVVEAPGGGRSLAVADGR